MHVGHSSRCNRTALSLLLALIAAGSQAQGAPALEIRTPPSRTHETSTRGDDDPLALTAEMAAFVDQRVGRSRPRLQRLLELQDAVFDPTNGLGIVYGSSLTRTAAETFEQRSGNCLSFTLLFVTLARHLGLRTHFVEVDEVTGWSQRGEIDLSHWHIYVEVELEGSIVPVDFLPWSDRRYRSNRRISEQRARAHYHNNVAVDALTTGSLETAFHEFEAALALDPGFNPAKINLAVAHRRNGDAERAERLLLEVLSDERRNSVAAANLASVYRNAGRTREAEKWLRRREGFLNRNPFHHFRLGLKALDGDRAREAKDHFKRAINRQSDEGLFFEQLAEANRRLREFRKARRNLRTAIRLTTDSDRQQVLSRRLLEMEQAPHAGSPAGD